MKLSKLKSFIRKSKGVHGDKYIYSKVNYTNSHTKVIIICKKHDEFEQRPSDHYNMGRVVLFVAVETN